MAQYEGFEDWDKYKPWVFRCSYCSVSFAFVLCIGLLGMNGVKQIHEDREWAKLTDRIHLETECNITGRSSKGLERKEFTSDCDGEPCPDEWRSWVVVRYFTTKDEFIEAICYSHIDDSYERSKSAAENFFRIFNPVITAPQRCCYNPSDTSEVRFCSWSTHDSYLGTTLIVVSVTFIALWTIYTLAIFIIKKTNCLEDSDYVDHIPLDGPADMELTDRDLWSDRPLP
eukprot:TRINITY_DN8731_c0_g1_i1.p1 TRINITY_DN8731_c0_g1~~TRINITY_DN8731_c0_g1_i1.p1  ORF type:complete len:228 (+),score=34.80 TRINITY_DN8731_c0_g1_i1:55-738(+)